MSNELKEHITKNISGFNTTPLAKKLVEADVSVQIYSEVRDMWNKLMKTKQVKSQIEDKVIEAKKSLERAFEIMVGSW